MAAEIIPWLRAPDSPEYTVSKRLKWDNDAAYLLVLGRTTVRLDDQHHDFGTTK
jgi:hypothetical protein